MAASIITPPATPPPPPQRDYRGDLSPELCGEVLGFNLLTRSNHPERVKRILRKLTQLMAAADALKAAATEAPQTGVL